MDGPLIRHFERLMMEELNNGIIRLDASIHEAPTSMWLREIEYVRRHRCSPLKLYITSPGGLAYCALALYDALQKVRADKIPVTAEVQGLAGSAAAMIVLQAAELRLATPNARFLLHEPRRWAAMEMRQSDMEDEIAEMQALSDRIVGIMATRCERSPDEVRELFRRKERWMSAQEAQSFGLIDAIAGGE